MSDIFDMLRDVPPPLVTMWGGWLATGLALALWHLRARDGEREYARQQASARRSRTRSGVRPPSGVGTSARPKAAGDAFGELEALLGPVAPTGNISRRPGD